METVQGADNEGGEYKDDHIVRNSDDNQDVRATVGVDGGAISESMRPSGQGAGPQKPGSSSQLDEARIAKAARFWHHPSLRDVPLEQKRAYLRHQGVTEAEIYNAWDRIVESSVDQGMGTNIDGSGVANTRSTIGAAKLDSNLGQTQALSSQREGPPHANAINAPAQATAATITANDARYGNLPSSMHPNTSQFGIPNQGAHPYQQSSSPYSYNPSLYSQAGMNHFNGDDGDDDYALTLTKGTTLVAVGSFVGLCAAASVRWLNGGDFTIFPPPTRRSLKSSGADQSRQQQQQQQRKDQQRVGDQLVSDDDSSEDGDGFGGNAMDHLKHEQQTNTGDRDEAIEFTSDTSGAIQRSIAGTISTPGAPTDASATMLSEMRSLSTALQSHLILQESILNKLTAAKASDLTDKSMDVLKSIPTTSNSDESAESDASSASSQLQLQLQLQTQMRLQMIWAELIEIKTQLHLSSSKAAATSDANANSTLDIDDVDENNTNGNEQVASTLTKLNKCLAMLETSVTTSPMDLNPKDSATALFARNAPSSNGPSPTIANAVSTPAAPNDADALKTPASRRSVAFVQDKASADVPSGDSHGSASSQSSAMEADGDVAAPRSIPDCFRAIVKENELAAIKAACQLLYLYIINLSANPTNSRYRKIFTTNESFQKVKDLNGGTDLLIAIGFEAHGSYFLWPKEGNHDESTKTLLSSVSKALNTLKSPTAASPTESRDDILQTVLQPMAALTEAGIEIHKPDQQQANGRAPNTRGSTDDGSRQQEQRHPNANGTPAPVINQDLAFPAYDQTPLGTQLMSPPTTKKHPYVPPSESPQVSSWSGAYLNALSRGEDDAAAGDSATNNSPNKREHDGVIQEIDEAEEEGGDTSNDEKETVPSN